MSFIRKLFAPKVKNSRPNYSFERDTTKLVGKPLSVVYGDRVHVFGNVVCRKMSSDLKQTRQGVALCWGPVTIHTETIRVNEKRPEYINGALNAQRNLEPGFISGLKVWTHAGNLGQAPAHGLIYGLNRTAYIWVEATANDDISGVDTVECDITRGNLFSSASPEDEYNTPIPAAIASAFPSGVRSSNPVAAALDYILNKDYGAGRDLSSFNGFTSWISAINQCDTVLNVASSVALGWAYGLRTDFLENGWYVEKLPAPDSQPTGYPGFAGPIAGTGSYDWNGIAISRSYRDLADGDFAVTAEAQPFSLMTLADENTQCTEEIGMDNPVTCTTTYEAQTYNKSVLFGLAKASTGNYVSDFLYAIHLTGDGLVEVWEDGAFETFNGGYAAGDTLTIDVTGTTVTYKKNGVAFKVSTRAVAPADYPLYLQTAIYQPGASIRFTEWTGVEGEHRYSASGEFGKGENDKHIDIINRLLDIANASVYEKDGIKCWIAKATAAVASLDRATFDPKGVDTADIMDIPNVVEVIYGSEDEDGERLSAIWEDPDVIAAWKETRETIDEEAIRTRTQASRKAAFVGRRAKAERKMVKGTADQRFMTLEPGDVVNVTMGTATTSWFTAKPFWVEEIVPENREGDVELTLTEYGGDELFDDSAATTIDQNDPILLPDPTVSLPNPASVPIAPTVFSSTVGVIEKKPTKLFYVDLTWNEPVQPQYMHDAFRVYRRAAPSADWDLIGTVSGRTFGFRDTTAKIETTSYLYAVVPVTTLGIEGAMPTLFNIFVSALALDNPAAPTSVNVAVQDDRSAIVTWSYGTPPVDFDGFTVKASPGTSYDDGSAIELSSGRIYEREISTTAINAPGNWTVAVFAHDTFGNVSDAGTHTVSVSAVPAPSALVATQTVNGVELSWTPPAGDVGLYYEVREGAVWGSATPVVKNHRSSSLFITLYDALQHTYQVAAIDRFGNYSTPIVVVSGVSSPASLTQFSATAQGDRVFFNWGTVEGIDIEYEVRRGESFDAGVQVFRTAGNSFDIMYPAAGTHTFWIKARSKVGLYSPSAIFATARIAPISSRNVLYEQDYFANGFPGQRYNFELVTVGGDDVLRVIKDGGINRQQAIYFDSVNLPARMFTRTWLDGVIGVSGDSPQWDEATFAWEDPEAEQAWSPLLQLGAGVQQDIIALDTAVADLPSTLIDAFTLNEATTGVKGTTAASATGIAYATARYLKGARIENGDALGWNVASTSDPWTVTFDICLPDATTTLGQREIARFTAGGSTFYVRYNDATSALTLTRDAGLETLSVTLDLVASDVVKLCVAQSATGRLLAAYSRESDSLVSDSGAHVSPGALSAVNFHPVNNATYDSANAVIGDVEVWDVAFTLSEFTEDMGVEFIRPAGYDDFAAFKSGDYEFENAIIGLRLVPDDPNSDFVIQRAKVVCDVEDVIDRGTEALSSGWNVITFARSFNVAPEVTATVIAGAAPASAEIRNVTTTQFEIHLIRISDGADVAGSVSWAALGY